MDNEQKMHSVRTKIALLTAAVVVVALGIATAIAVTSIRDLGRNDAHQEADVEERFVRAKIAADRVKDDPQAICGYYDLG